MHTKEKILLEGMKLFATLGYNGTSMTKIASQVGLKKSSLYTHYNSKEALFLDVTAAIAEDYVRFVKSTFENEGKSTEEKLYLSFQAHVEDMANHEDSLEFYNRFSSYPPQGLEDKVLELLRESEKQAREAFKNVVEKAQEQGDITSEISATEITHAFYGLLDGLSYETNYFNFDIIKSHGESMWKVFWRGVMA